MPEITAEAKVRRTRNDEIRGRLPSADPDDRVVITAGIRWLGPVFLVEVLKQVREFADFTSDNDPYGEHDFGAFEISTGDKCFWKIDDYDGYEGIRCVLTIMLAEEY
jgi:hypothetical protein